MKCSHKALTALAEAQAGYFTAKQAKACGFVSSLHVYNCQAGHWRWVQRGLYRLPGFPDTPEAAFICWFLWSRNETDQPQGVISHQSALAAHGQGEFDPQTVHLTVPPTFRKKPPAGCILHKASLNLSAIESRGSFLLTSLPQTLADLQTETGARIAPDSSPLAAGPWPLPVEPTQSQVEPQPAGRERERIFEMIYNRTRRPALSVRPPAVRRREAGFTLVELLVVVAIISVLMGMLLPALDRALASARQAACAGRQKQLWLLTQLYADSYAGRYFPGWGNAANGCGPLLTGVSVTEWVYYLAPLAGIDYQVVSPRWPKSAPLFFCPVAKDGLYGYSLPKIPGNPPWSYSYNWEAFGLKRNEQIADPHTLFMGCGNWYVSDRPDHHPSATAIVGWHVGRTNILWGDGSNTPEDMNAVWVEYSWWTTARD